MLTTDIQRCQHCKGPIHPENHAIDPTDEDRVKEWLYCEYCEIGWEVTKYRNGDMKTTEYRAKTAQRKFEWFMCKLIKARAA